MSQLPKIFIYQSTVIIRNGQTTEEGSYIALAEDGNQLAHHYSSTANFAKLDLGLSTKDFNPTKESLTTTGRQYREKYELHYPNGFEMEFVPYEIAGGNNPHPGLFQAFKNVVALHTKITE